MAYPVFKSVIGHHGMQARDGDLAAFFLKLYPRKTKGKRDSSQRSRARRRSAKRSGR